MTITGFERPLTADEVRWAVEQAARAPSLHNSQPWRFRWIGGTFELYADMSRVLSSADANGRELVVSCGAALFNLRVALRKVGFDARVHLLPDARDPRLLARVITTESSPATAQERKTYAALLRRQTHRGGFEERPVPPSVLVELQRAAEAEGAELIYVHDFGQRRRVLELARRADRVMSSDVRVRAEIAEWTPPPESRRRDGVPATSYEAEPRHEEDDLPARDFDQARGQGSLPAATAAAPAGVVAVLATTGDVQVDWLMGGEALQRVLVTAAQHHVLAAIHSQLAEVSSLRNELRREFYDGGYPQLLLRLGYASPSPAPMSPRRPVAEVLDLT